MNSPPGTDACPFPSSPQQIAVLSGLIPHECASPAEIAMNSPQNRPLARFRRHPSR